MILEAGKDIVFRKSLFLFEINNFNSEKFFVN